MFRSWSSRAPRAVALAALVFVASGCDDDDTIAGGAPPSGTPPVTITGRERLAWEQAASSQAEVDSYRFTVFVDGAPAGALPASCTAAGGAGAYSCVANLPSLTPGSHRLAIQTTNSGGASSAVSADLAIVLQGAARTTSLVAALTNALPISLAQVCLGSQPSQRCFELQQIGTQLTSPTHPRELPDGRIVLIDDGRLAEVQDGRSKPISIATPARYRVADISVPPGGATTREVYLLEVSPGDAAMGAADVVRYREVNGIFGERAVIVPDIAVPRDGDPVLFVDDQILVGLPYQGEPGSGARRFGTVLRFDRRGGSAGYRVGTPVLAWGAGQPTSLFKSGDSVGLAGLSTGNVTFGLLAPGTTMPAAVTVTDRLTAAGGVRAIQRVGDLVLLATGDGTLQLGDADARGGMPTGLQRLDTRGVVVTGLGATRGGGLVATAILPPSSGGARVGVVYQLVPRSQPGRK